MSSVTDTLEKALTMETQGDVRRDLEQRFRTESRSKARHVSLLTYEDTGRDGEALAG